MTFFHSPKSFTMIQLVHLLFKQMETTLDLFLWVFICFLNDKLNKISISPQTGHFDKDSLKFKQASAEDSSTPLNNFVNFQNLTGSLSAEGKKVFCTTFLILNLIFFKK